MNSGEMTKGHSKRPACATVCHFSATRKFHVLDELLYSSAEIFHQHQVTTKLINLRVQNGLSIWGNRQGASAEQSDSVQSHPEAGSNE